MAYGIVHGTYRLHAAGIAECAIQNGLCTTVPEQAVTEAASAGMAAPVWVSAVSSTPVGACVPALSTTFSGIMVLGIADSAASAIGRRFGRRRILGTRKTLEGTLGAILCTVVGWLVLWPMCRCRGHENLDRCALQHAFCLHYKCTHML